MKLLILVQYECLHNVLFFITVPPTTSMLLEGDIDKLAGIILY